MIGQRLLAPGKSVPAIRIRPGEIIERPAHPLRIDSGRITGILAGSWLVQLMLVMTLIALAALIYLYQASQVNVLQFNIADLRQQQSQLNLQNANLYASASALSSLPRVEKIAATQLHMTHPDLSNTLWVYQVVPPSSPALPLSTPAQARAQSLPITWIRHLVRVTLAAL